MNNLLEQLRKYSQEIDLSKRYEYSVDFNNSVPNSISQLESFKNCNNSLEWNGILKAASTKYFQHNSSSDLEVERFNFWIINKWGGINGFKENEKNKNKIKKFKDELKKGKLTRDTFSTISSLSKLSSFWDCKNYAIYDSKVIYSINWLILKLSQQKKYFPIPSGRNKVIANYNIDTVIRLFHKDRKDDELYYSYKEAYNIYCELIRDWSLKLWSDKHSERQQYPFYLEMLLFLVADKEIFEDIKKSISITIK